MPVYNCAKYVGSAIDSVLAQTYQHWELIVVDDGSTDSTPSVLRRYSDPRIRVISQANRGEAAARNAGLDVATGEYVAFLDADDLYLSNALSDMVGYLDSAASDGAVYTNGYFGDASGHPVMTMAEHRPSVFGGDILESLVLSPGLIFVCSAMARRTLLEATNLRFDLDLVVGPDWAFWAELASHCRFGYVSTPTCIYRIHQGSITTSIAAEKRRESLVLCLGKMTGAWWFGRLSPAGQASVFYRLLVGLLDVSVARQQRVLSSRAFAQLDVESRGCLYRQVATRHLLSEGDAGFAYECLGRALLCDPGDSKSRVLLALARRTPAGARGILTLWRGLLTAKRLAEPKSTRRKPIPGVPETVHNI